MSDLSTGIAPRVKPLPTRRGSVLPVIDVGSHKIVCMIAELEPLASGDATAGRTHKARVIGIGHQRSLGLKRGAVIDMEAAEQAIRHTIDAAERMAKLEIRSAIVALGGGRLWAHRGEGALPMAGQPVTQADVERVIGMAAHGAIKPGRVLLHAEPAGFSVDGTRGIVDPRGMIGGRLGCDLTVVTSDQTAVRNLMLAVERCHIEVDAIVATPYASALACLIDDEADMGAVVIDLGAGSTSIAVLEGGRLVHVDAVAVGGHHITTDLARGLSMRISDAERIKAQHGVLSANAADERDLITIPQVDEGERDTRATVPRAAITRIIRPRAEEILEVVRDRLTSAGIVPKAGRRLVFTGGASQLIGLADLARSVLGAPIRLGRPLGVKGLPEAAKGPAYSAAVGLIIYPQFAEADRIEIRNPGTLRRTGTDGYLARVSRWLRDSF